MIEDRRRFMAGVVASLAGAASGLTVRPGFATATASPRSSTKGSAGPRRAAFELALRRQDATQASNGDEVALPSFLAAYTKCLPHSDSGLVDQAAYRVYLEAIESRSAESFERIPLGGFVKLANPQAAFATDLVGPSPTQVACPPAPRFASAEQAGELVELYWKAHLRDLAFAEYESSPLAARAARELSALSDFRGPKRGGVVSARTIFRGTTDGDLEGPYLSQFLLLPIPMRPLVVEQRIRTVVPSRSYLTEFAPWLAIQNGQIAGVASYDPQPRYIRNGRDLAEYVNRDFTYQAFLGACLLSLRLGALPDGGSPYKHSRTQSAFVTFGQPFLLSLVALASQVALTACWYQKWVVHRRLRPEEYAGRVEAQLAGRASFPLPSELLDSDALAEARRWNGTALLSQVYPEGAPTHPSYPAGHAVIAGACATVLKACLDETHVVPAPVEASEDGLKLTPYRGAPLTIGGELDKLASNIALGRDFAGVHWRSDGAAGLELGEMVAIELLRELRLTGNELFAGYSLRKFDGTQVRVG